MSEEVKDQVAEVENTEKCDCGCGCGCEAGAAAPKKSGSQVARIVIWAVMLVLVLVFVFFRNDMIEYLKRGQNTEMINNKAEEELGYKPYKVEALGDYKFKVTLKEKTTDNKKGFNVVNFQVKDGILDFVDEQKDYNNWVNMSEKKTTKSKPAEKPAAEK